MHRLATLLPHGVARRDDLAGATSTSTVGRWLARGSLVELHPGVLVLPDRAVEWDVRAEAAVLWTAGALSHASALVAHGWLRRNTRPVHVTVPIAETPRDTADVIVHRTSRPIRWAATSGLLVTARAQSLLDAWSWASSPRRNAQHRQDMADTRHAVITAVRERDVTMAALRSAAADQPRHAGCRELVALLDLLDRGCRSELEIFGVLHVLELAGLPPPKQQREVRLPDGRRVFLDAAWPQAGVAVELDGQRFHASRADRERDMRRDTALAVLGWVVLRFSYERVTTDPKGCRREIASVVRQRWGTFATQQ